MSGLDYIFLWLAIVTFLGTLLAICSAYFAYWFLVIRNPVLTEVVADYKIRKYREEE